MRVQMFVDRQGNQIDEQKWRQLSDDPTYVIVRQYMNDEWLVRALWVGKLDFFAKSQQEADSKMTPFMLVSWFKGRKEEKKVFVQKESTLINLYEDFLVRRDLATFVMMGDETIRFLENGNQFVMQDLRKKMGLSMNEVLPETIGDW